LFAGPSECAFEKPLYRLLRISTYHGFMDKSRAAQRHRVLKAGTIAFNGGAINCTVRNLSTSGAALDVTSPVGIPEHFVLVSNGSQLRCRVVWRKETRIGVTFG
jgi:hypothetical protein